MARRGKQSSTLSTITSHCPTTQDSFTSGTDSQIVDIGDEEYPINCILDETRTRYLIDWKGPYSPTWEPKECANDAAIEAWEEKKKVDIQSRRRRRLYRGKRRQSAHSVGSSQQSSAEPERSNSQSPSPLFLPGKTVPETQSTESTHKTTGEHHIIQGSASLESSNPPSTTGTSSVENTPLRSIGATLQTLGAIQKSSVNSTQSSLVTGTHISSSSAISGSIGSSHDRIVNQYCRSLRDVYYFQTTTIQADEIAETQSIPEALPVRVETPSTQAKKSTQSQISSIPETVFDSNQNPVRSQTGYGLHNLSQRTLSVSVRHTQDSNPRTEPILCRRITPLFPTLYSYYEKNSAIMENSPDSSRAPKSGVPERYDHVPGSTPREKLRSLYAQLQADFPPRTLQSVSASATPSSAGDIEPAAASAPETTSPLSIRVDKEPTSHAAPADLHDQPGQTYAGAALPEYHEGPLMQTIQPSDLTVVPAEEAPPGSVQLGASEFAMTLPMDSRVKDVYERILTDESHVIKNFHSLFTSESILGNNEREQVISQMRRVVEKLNNTTVHPDLNIAEHIQDSPSDPEKEAAWAEYSSSKFQLLGYFVEMAESHELHIILMVREEKTVDLVERYLLGKGFEYTRPRSEMGSGTNVEISMTKGALSFGIRSAQSDGVIELYRNPTAIFSLDSSFNAKNPSIEHLRTTFARNGNLLPVVLFLISNSSEHIERCLPNLAELQRLRLLAHYIYRLHDTVGDLQDDALNVHEDAEELLSYLLSDNFNASWSWPTIEPLQILSPAEIASALGPEAIDPSVQYMQTAGSLQKRVLDGDDPDARSTKRQRFLASQDTSQVSDSTAQPTQTLDNDLQSLERSLIQMKNTHAIELRQLRATLSEAQSGNKQKTIELAGLQHRYESRTKDLHKTRQERDRLAETVTKLEQRLERQRDEISKLKDERTQLKHDLEAAREALKSGGGLEADLEAAREEVRRLLQENANLERRADYEKKQSEYTREQYQNASTAAAQSGLEIRQLKEQNEELKRKATANAAQLKEIKTSNDDSRHYARVQELEATLASRDELLRRKEDELRDLKRNRPSTRSTSTQPRSPKWASTNSRPTSPGVNNSGATGRGSALRFSSEMST
ncbi:hypothetical protein DTO282E5_6537 [Paecilomyces variotii]|nr:hypothetical protein DTO282E5_6537 [Paecilomyces variotii]